MKYLLDTNVLSDARKQSHPGLNSWLATQPRDNVAISVVSLLEIERGVLRVERRDPDAGKHLRSWLDNEIPMTFRRSILPIDKSISIQAARLHVPDPMPEMDALIAGTALAHDLTLVTRNVKDFHRSGIQLLDPWEL